MKRYVITALSGRSQIFPEAEAYAKWLADVAFPSDFNRRHFKINVLDRYKETILVEAKESDIEFLQFLTTCLGREPTFTVDEQIEYARRSRLDKLPLLHSG